MFGSDDAESPDNSFLLHTRHGALGPFEPPSVYAFEPELRDPPPRSVPSALNHGRFAKWRRRRFAGGLVLGLACFAIAPLAGGLFMPLGLGILGLTGATFVVRRMRKGPFEYVERGIPLVARVCALAIRPTSYYLSEPTRYEFAALLQHRDPASGDIVFSETVSSKISSGIISEYTTSYRVGDYATAVYLPSDPAGSLRLYGFLDLRPGIGIVSRPRVELAETENFWLSSASVTFIIAQLLFGSYPWKYYSPIDLTFGRVGWPLAVGALAMGVPGLWFTARRTKRKRREVEQRNARALATGRPIEVETKARGWFGGHGTLMGTFIVCLCLFVGGWTGLMLTFAANSLLDASPARPRPISITEVHGSKVKYQFDGDNATYRLRWKPEGIDQAVNNRAVAVVRDGWLGWEWVETIEPPPPR